MPIKRYYASFDVATIEAAKAGISLRGALTKYNLNKQIL